MHDSGVWRVRHNIRVSSAMLDESIANTKHMDSNIWSIKLSVSDMLMFSSMGVSQHTRLNLVRCI